MMRVKKGEYRKDKDNNDNNVDIIQERKRNLRVTIDENK